MLTKRYMPSVKNLPDILEKIRTGTAPSKFTVNHLKKIGFTSSGDRAVIPLLKDLGFLASDGGPTPRYHAYRNPAQSRSVLGEAIKEAYEDVFHFNAKPTQNDREAIEGIFKSTHNVTDRVAQFQAMTFFKLLEQADVSHDVEKESPKKKKEQPTGGAPPETPKDLATASLQLRHNIEIHLPATKDIEVYNAIFKALKEHLL